MEEVFKMLETVTISAVIPMRHWVDTSDTFAAFVILSSEETASELVFDPWELVEEFGIVGEFTLVIELLLKKNCTLGNAWSWINNIS